MIHKDFQKNSVERDLSLCVVEKFSGFELLKFHKRIRSDNNLRSQT